MKKNFFQITTVLLFILILEPVHAQIMHEPASKEEAFDQELLQLIEEYKRHRASGNSTEAENLYEQIRDIGKHAYPDRLQELQNLVEGNHQPVDQNAGTEAPSGVAGTDQKWYFIQSDKALQYSFSLVREEAGIGYAQVGVRINKRDDIYCDHPNCEGYIWYFSYRTPNDEKREHHFYFANTFDGVYKLNFLIPFAIKTYPDGSRQAWSDSKKFIVYYLRGYSEEYMTRKFYNCVDDKLSDYAGNRCREFKMEMATIVR